MSASSGDDVDGDVDWHTLSAEEAVERLETDVAGLDTDEARDRLDAYGPNEITASNELSPFRILLAQFQDFLIYLLLLTAALSLGIGLLPGYDPDYADATLILLILLANGVFGFVQDYQAEKSIAALRELSSPEATVLRECDPTVVDATAVVPGDIPVLEAGDSVPADARLVETTELRMDESVLTGESTGVAKSAESVAAETPLAERADMVYMNTPAVEGRARAVAVRTGMDTEVGSIATQIRSAPDEPTPFQAEVDRLGKRIGYGIVALILVVVEVVCIEVIQSRYELSLHSNPWLVGAIATTMAMAMVIWAVSEPTMLPTTRSPAL
ncbi:P-type ATPase [Haloplanus natans]|uniref:P-type ATPase n=1 Tax=Haloplanus natans TaxID=376171 RepID=UPI0006780DCE|nr:cation-transporting P-type ATPase [Haloplanus natans]